MNLTVQKRTGISSLLVIAIAAFAVTLFLFYIDEGNYSLENITHPGNIVALSFYFVGMILAQALTLAIAERFTAPRKALIISITTGIPVGIAITILSFYALHS